MIWKEVVCLGDSLTYGARDEFGRSYPAELARILSLETGEAWFCHNHGVNGDTSSDVLRRCWRVFAAHPRVRLATLLVGTNDVAVPIPMEIYRDNLLQIIAAARVHGMHLVLGELPPVGFHPGVLGRQDAVAAYSAEVRRIAAEQGLAVCSFDGLAGHLVDGLHFGHEGYVRMAGIWAHALLDLGRGPSAERGAADAGGGAG
jgi:lysophospholipase L1-like esterase